MLVFRRSVPITSSRNERSYNEQATEGCGVEQINAVEAHSRGAEDSRLRTLGL